MDIHFENRDDAQCQHAQAIVIRHVRELFKLLPRLAGFRVGTDLAVADVLADSSPARNSTRGLYTVVTQSIVELAECHPEALRFMRGRTFARSLH